VINDDRVQPGSGFGMHGHSDMEIITVMLEGELTHRYSMGHSALLRAGEVQWMGAASGIMRSEWNQAQSPCHLLQIWIKPHAAGLAPSYAQRSIELGDQWTLLVAADGQAGALPIRGPARLWRTHLGPGEGFDLLTHAGGQSWLQLAAGSLEIEGGMLLQAGHGLGFAAGAINRISAGGTGVDALLFAMD
jgi:redox-sensitive bicupin YhaK (pirin superfamily)